MFVAEAGSPIDSGAANTAAGAFLRLQAIDQTFLPLPGAVVTVAASPPILPDLPLFTVLKI